MLYAFSWNKRSDCLWSQTQLQLLDNHIVCTVSSCRNCMHTAAAKITALYLDTGYVFEHHFWMFLFFWKYIFINVTVADFCLGTYRLANLCKIHNGRLHSELPVKNKTQESVINFNIWGSCLQHTFHGMAAVCKWPVAIHANIYIELFIQISLQFACVCDLLMSLAI